MSGPIGLVTEELASCVACGLCLPHCPTFRVTGQEAASPRGRIAAMRHVEWEGGAIDAVFARVIDECVQCRGCETACPSGVPFGHLVESTQAELARRGLTLSAVRRLPYAVIGRHRLLRVLTALGAIAQRLRVLPSRRLGLPRLPLRQHPLVAGGADGLLFTGCVMDAWQRPIHAATMRVLDAAGLQVRPTGADAPCCGALHQHAGMGDRARALATEVIGACAGDKPILVNSAGCGAMLKDYGRLLQTPAATAFSARVVDVHEWLAPRVGRLPEPRRPTVSGREAAPVAISDACHLRHVQRADTAVRTVLAPFVETVELDDEGLCCGAGGAYATRHRGLAGAIRDRKIAAIDRAGATTVTSANPGCSVHLSGAGVDVVHPMELIDAALGADEEASRHGG